MEETSVISTPSFAQICLRLEMLDWPKLIASVGGAKTNDADKVTIASSLKEEASRGRGDVTFRNDMNASPGWIDLELLLRTLATVQARAIGP